MNLTEKKLREIIRETINELDENPCWDGYTQLGTKMKDGKEVPNCVPVSEANVIRSLKEGDTEYQAYFRKELEKTGKSSPADMTDDEKRDFFSKVDKGWSGKTESVSENLSPDVAKHMGGIYKGFIKVEGDGTMVYDSPSNATKAAKYLNSKKIAASSDGKFLYIESVNESFKHIISIDTPTQVISKPVQKQIENLAKKGVRSKEIGLQLNFTANDRVSKLVTNNFQKMKNKVYFEMDKRESIKEGNAFGMAVTKAKKEGKTEFEFNGKTYKVKKGSYEKNEAKNKKEN
jgi:hypothetical protein